jgi:dihydroorotase
LKNPSSPSWCIYNGIIINERTRIHGYLLIKNGLITEIAEGQPPPEQWLEENAYTRLDAEGAYVMPGLIDDQVHFRDPGLTHKGDLLSESRAAVAGGITSFMDMPNTIPQTTTCELLDQKLEYAAAHAMANYAFYLGATNDNIAEIRRVDPLRTCGIKVFMGASTGNMLVDQPEMLDAIFRESPLLIAIHSEYEPIIRQQLERVRQQYGDDIPHHLHPVIRNSAACLKSTQIALELARRYNSRLHILHLSTAEECTLLDGTLPDEKKRITAEVCVHHLWFCDEDYTALGSRIKWNPAIKSAADRESLRKALLDGRIDVVATDHAPHTLEEKSRPYLQCPSGGPLVQHALPMMMELCHKGILSPEIVAEKMCHHMAQCFSIEKRGFLRKQYHADVVIVKPDDPWTVHKDNLLYKCGWSPLEGQTFSHRITHTFINGEMVFGNKKFNESFRGQPLLFSR